MKAIEQVVPGFDLTNVRSGSIAFIARQLAEDQPEYAALPAYRKPAQGASNMQFKARFGTVSAAHVTLDGVELTVISAGGRAHCVPAEFFALFFQPAGVEAAQANAAQVVDRLVEKLSPARPSPLRAKQLSPVLPKVEPPLKKTEGSQRMSLKDAILAAVGESAMTGVEVADRALLLMGFNPKDAKERAKVQSMIHYLGKQNRIVRRECPVTHLDKWYLVSKPQANGQPKA